VEKSPQDEDQNEAFAAELEACMDSDDSHVSWETDEPDLLTTLPEEILARILNLLPHASLLSSALRRTNKRFGEAVALASTDRTRERLRQSLQDGFAADRAPAPASSGSSASTSSSTVNSTASGSTSTATGFSTTTGGDYSTSTAGSSSNTSVSNSNNSSSEAEGASPDFSRGEPPGLERERLDLLAFELELALRTCGAFRLKYRQLVFNLRDPKNPQLRRRLLTGELAPTALLQLSGHNMASVELQQQRAEWKKKRQRECVRERPLKGFVTNLYRCDRCDGTQAAVHRALRAGQRHIDRARTYATCVECSHRWEV